MLTRLNFKRGDCWNDNEGEFITEPTSNPADAGLRAFDWDSQTKMNTTSPNPNPQIKQHWILGSTVLSLGSTHPMPLHKMKGRSFARFNCTGADQDLTIFEPNIDSPDALRFQTETFEFGLQTYRDVIFLAYRCGPFYGDAPCSWHLNPTASQVHPIPMSSTDARLGLMVALVDSTNGIIKGLRLTPLSAMFSQSLNGALTNQARRPWVGMDDYKKQVQAGYSHWPNPKKMMRDAPVRSKEMA